MKMIFSLLLSTLPVSAAEFSLPPVQPMRYGGRGVQPCVIWYENGRCARFASPYDAASRAEVNQRLQLLEAKIRELESRLR